jgi:2-polyprenyl-6-methoxyphenol hydroxylase-like FAD-dependent oxidoreductase
MRDDLPSLTDVLLIGAGPTGLALATTLRQAEVSHVLIDRLEAGQTTSRAAVIHAHTLEALQELGVSERLVAAGLKLSRFSIRDRDRVLVTLGFEALPTPFSFLLMLPQDVTERILTERFLELGGMVHRNVVAESIEQVAERSRVTMIVRGERRCIESRYVVGADGMNSLVRQSAGIEFKGERYEQSFVLADVHMDWPLGRDEVMLFFSPAGLVVVAPLPNGQFRIVAVKDDAPERLDIATIQAILDASGPVKAPARIRAVSWSSRFRLHHRLASAYRRGPLLLMGDAAHVHSPAGGQGMNTGLVDATVLGRLLVRVLKEHKPDSTLESYEQLRRPAAQTVLQIAGDLTNMAMMKGGAARLIRNARLTAAGHLPVVKRRMAMNLSGLSRRAAAQLPP